LNLPSANVATFRNSILSFGSGKGRLADKIGPHKVILDGFIAVQKGGKYEDAR